MSAWISNNSMRVVVADFPIAASLFVVPGNALVSNRVLQDAADLKNERVLGRERPVHGAKSCRSTLWRKQSLLLQKRRLDVKDSVEAGDMPLQQCSVLMKKRHASHCWQVLCRTLPHACSGHVWEIPRRNKRGMARAKPK